MAYYVQQPLQILQSNQFLPQPIPPPYKPLLQHLRQPLTTHAHHLLQLRVLMNQSLHMIVQLSLTVWYLVQFDLIDQKQLLNFRSVINKR